MNIEIFGGSERQRFAKQALTDGELEFESLKLLPVPTTKDGTRITGTEILVSDFVESVVRGDFVIGYGIPEEAKRELLKKGAQVYDAKDDEDFLRDNAYVTAIGTLAYLLDTEKKIPRDLSFGVIGYGRIGKALVELLLFLGARVKVFSSKLQTQIELGACGIESPGVALSGLNVGELSDLDVVINTAPTKLSYVFPEKKVPQSLRVLDLASGDSFPGVLGVEYLPSIPDRMYPESAGALYARCALDAASRKEK